MSKMFINGKEYKGRIWMNDSFVMQENKDGTWSEASPYPFITGFLRKRFVCDCGFKFKTLDDYYSHHRAEHTDGKRYKRTMAGMVEVIDA